MVKQRSDNLVINLKERTDGKITCIDVFLDQLSLPMFNKHDEFQYFFRGHANREWEAKPSIYRDESFIKNEHLIFREIISRCPEDFKHIETTFQKLVKMQHYGLPTRLLDITTNPLIALYFACLGNQENDGEVIVFKVPKEEVKFFDSDQVSILSNLSRLKELRLQDTSSNIAPEAFCQTPEISLLLHEIRQEKTGFLPNINPQHLHSVVCVRPILDNARIIKQEGAFFIYGIGQIKSECPVIPESYLFPKEDDKIFILNESKENILKQLSTLSINEATLFPEITNVAESIKKLYMS